MPQLKRSLLPMLLAAVLLLSGALVVLAIGEPTGTADDLAPAVIVNDEGGPVLITGSVTYTNPFFTLGVAQPVIILEDQAGFVDRNEYYVFPPESQVLGQITTDFYRSPFQYSLSLPIEPRAALRDVAGTGGEGVMIYAVAYWTNKFGDAFLEERDLYGGGWSTAYASTRVSDDPTERNEIVGGKLLIYAPDDQQGFPSGFGPDGLLFTEDDPLVRVPQGYTVVDMDREPFVFDRSRHAVIDLIEPTTAAVSDFSNMSYSQAFDEMIEKMRREYAFTEFYNIDWDALVTTYRPRFVSAQANRDFAAYSFAMRDLILNIPDGHVSVSFTQPLAQRFVQESSGGVGMSIRELDDGRILVSYLLPGGPAVQAGIQLQAEVLEIAGRPAADYVADVVPWTAPFSTRHTERLEQLTYAMRFPLQTSVSIRYRNPGGEARTVSLSTVPERDSFFQSSIMTSGLTGFELPLEYSVLPGGYVYVKIYSFSDNELLTVQLWERMIRVLNQNNVPGLIIDMRQNGGGFSFLGHQMAAHFFNERLPIGQRGRYSRELDDFYYDERGIQYFYPPAPEMRYHGPIAVLIGAGCFSACEFFTYAMTIEGRATIVGHYPTGGLGGGIERFYMPDGMTVTFTVTRGVDMDGNIHIEGVGIVPDVRVPVTEETLFGDTDAVLDAAVSHLNSTLGR